MQGQRKYYSTDEKLPPDNWDEEAQYGKFLKKGKVLELDIKKINSNLADLERKIEKIVERFKLDGQLYTSWDKGFSH